MTYQPDGVLKALWGVWDAAGMKVYLRWEGH